MPWQHKPGTTRTPRVSVPKVAVPKVSVPKKATSAHKPAAAPKAVVKPATTGGKTAVYTERNRPRTAKTVSKPKGIHN